MRPKYIALLAVFALCANAQPSHKTENVLLVMTDGLRWQEVFQGADAALMDDKNHEVAAGQREALLPFFWQVIAKNGQIYGNRKLGSDAYVTNGFNFSYPGYNETLSGFADPRIHSNDKVANPNVTVLEWLNQKPAYRGKVAAFGAWGVISSIVNGARGGFVANSGYDALTAPPVTERLAAINRLKDETRVWDDEPFDSFAFQTALEYLRLHRPRVMYLSLGETDEWAHRGDYALYLRSAHRVDQYLKELWETVQSIGQYRGKTTLIFLTDHGRGQAAVEWKSHGEKIPDSKYIWMAFLGPDTRAVGERTKVAPVTQSQIAATLAALLGEDYAGAVPKAGKPIEDVLH
jgi:Sulfatase